MNIIMNMKIMAVMVFMKDINLDYE
jgi:hypothetical protein